MKKTNRNYRKKSNKEPISIDRSLPIKRLRVILFFGVLILALLILRVF